MIDNKNIYEASKLLTKEQILYIKSHPVYSIINLLNAENHHTRIIGGAVRDLLLGIAVKDFDIATTIIPSDVILMLNKNNIDIIDIHTN